MALREGRIEGVPARIARVTFTGERSFEITVPAGYGASLLGASAAARPLSLASRPTASRP